VYESNVQSTGIWAEGLGKRFGENWALRDVDLHAPAGSVLGLLGHNGAGKTTAIRILTTLSLPTEGRATVAGLDVVRDAARVRAQIGLAGQYASVDELLTARANLELTGRLYHLPRDVVRRRTDELLQRVRLDGVADDRVSTFSGGMRRRLDLAASLIARPPVLFLDEPTTGLDPQSRSELWDLLRELVADGATLILTTQYLDEADRLADQLAIVDRGRVVVQGTPEALKSELRGDAIQVELAGGNGNGRVEATLRSLPGLSDTATEGRTVRARAEHGATAIPAVLAALDREGLAVASVTLQRPSLDDVYLRYAGRVYHDEKEAA
jgi:daunorubicin resistance ABC transporter ATP-binding subunit